MDIFLQDDLLLFCVLLTVKVAGCAAAISLGAGTALAWIMVRKNFPGKKFLDTLCTLPLVLPPTVIGYCLILLLGKRGVIGSRLAEFGINLIFSWQGAVVAVTVVIFPLSYRAAKIAFETVDHTLEQAARTLGASEWRVFFLVSLPLAWRGIFSGNTLAFARGMGEFGATLMLAGNLPGKTQTLSLAIYDAFQSGNDARALMLVFISAALCMSLLAAAEYISLGGWRHSRKSL